MYILGQPDFDYQKPCHLDQQPYSEVMDEFYSNIAMYLKYVPSVWVEKCVFIIFESQYIEEEEEKKKVYLPTHQLRICLYFAYLFQYRHY